MVTMHVNTRDSPADKQTWRTGRSQEHVPLTILHVNSPFFSTNGKNWQKISQKENFVYNAH